MKWGTAYNCSVYETLYISCYGHDGNATVESYSQKNF
jgi:hypothetical protein